MTITPDQISGLGYWYKADALALAEGAAVSSWADSSGNGNTLAQATATQQPTYRATGLNGKACVEFDGVADYLSTVSSATNNTATGTVVVVWQPTANATGKILIEKWDGSFAGPGYPYVLKTSTSQGAAYAKMTFADYDGTKNPIIEDDARIAVDPIARIHMGTFDSSALTFYRDGWKQKSTTQTATGTRTNAARLSVGGRANANGTGAGSLWSSARIAEIIYYTRVLTDTERVQLNTYLGLKYGIGTAGYSETVTPSLNPASIALTSTPSRLSIASYDGSNALVHPSVLDTGSPGWNGRRYWMAVTPYPNQNDNYENPSVYYSGDGTTWIAPATNPVVAAVVDPAFNSDPDLVLVGSTMYLFYRYATSATLGTATANMFYRTSTDGVTWSADTVSLSGKLDDWASPAYLFDGTTWHMWSVKVRTDPDFIEYRTASSPSGPWTLQGVCRFDGYPDTREMWHIDVIKDGSSYLMLINDRIDGAHFGGRMLLASSDDGLNWKAAPQLIADNGSQDWYRSTLVKDAGVGYKLWLTEYHDISGAYVAKIDYATAAATAPPAGPTLAAVGGSLSVIGGTISGRA